MKFAIKHNKPHHYLQKEKWNWVDTLDESTVYSGFEVFERLTNNFDETASNLHILASETQIVAVREVNRPIYEEVI